jgi:hypothetical protein
LLSVLNGCLAIKNLESDGRAAHLEASRNCVYGAVGLDEQIQHPASRRMTDGPMPLRFSGRNGRNYW